MAFKKICGSVYYHKITAINHWDYDRIDMAYGLNFLVHMVFEAVALAQNGPGSAKCRALTRQRRWSSCHCSWQPRGIWMLEYCSRLPLLNWVGGLAHHGLRSIPAPAARKTLPHPSPQAHVA